VTKIQCADEDSARYDHPSTHKESSLYDSTNFTVEECQYHPANWNIDRNDPWGSYTFWAEGTPDTYWPATARHTTGRSDRDTEHEEYLSCVSEWFHLIPGSKTILPNEVKILTHNVGNLGIDTTPIFQQVVNEHPRLITDSWEHNTPAKYWMCEAIIQFDIWFSNISCLVSSQQKRSSNDEGGRSGLECKKWEFLWFSFGVRFCLWVYGLPLVYSFPLGLHLSLGFMFCIYSFGFRYVVIWKRRNILHKKGLGEVVVGKSISHHHYQSVE